MSQLNRSIDIFEDRKNELSEYFKVTPEEITNIFEGDKKHEIFDDVTTDEKLHRAYIERMKIATIGHMLKYTRFDQAFYLLRYFNSRYNPSQRNDIKILDYGCSVADYGLAFALHGYSVILCDIQNGNIELGKWRFEKRNLIYTTIPIYIDNLYPHFTDLDIVIACEVLEHIRNPLIAIKNIFNGLNENGYFWTSSYPVIRPKTGRKHPDHLIEAAEMRDDVLKYTLNNFSRIKIENGFLFQKK